MQEAAEHVHAGPLHRVDQQHLGSQIVRGYPALLTEGVIRRHHQGEIEGEQGLEVEIPARLHVRGEQQVELAAEQGADGIEAGHRLHLQRHPGPLAAKARQQRQQPLDAAVAIQRQVQPARIPAVQGQQLALGLGQGGQHLTGQGQQMLAGRRQYQGAALAQIELQVEAGLQLFQLVGEGGLGEVEAERRPRQGALLGQGTDGLQVLEIDARVGVLMAGRLVGHTHGTAPLCVS
ncbi:hypothetical protein D3C79_698670 [compost metagenome]